MAMDRPEMYTYESPTLLYAMNWSSRPDKPFRLALGSFVEDYNNRVEIISLDDQREALRCAPGQSFQHPYPPTKVAFFPDKDGTHSDLLATSGDFLRLWRITEEGVALDKLLNNNKSSEFCAPITSFDWNEAEPRRLASSSIDTTVTVWDVDRGAVETQLIAHDREVYDVAWGGAAVFASVSADGSVRVFDLRDKEHSTIIYECPTPDTPLLRLAWNRQDPRYMACIAMDSPRVAVLDIRFPTLPVTELARHQAAANSLAWAPHSACHICTAADDCQALIWDLSSAVSAGRAVDATPNPILAYNAGAEINLVAWSGLQPDWVAICLGNRAQVLRV